MWTPDYNIWVFEFALWQNGCWLHCLVIFRKTRMDIVFTTLEKRDKNICLQCFAKLSRKIMWRVVTFPCLINSIFCNRQECIVYFLFTLHASEVNVNGHGICVCVSMDGLRIILLKMIQNNQIKRYTYFTKVPVCMWTRTTAWIHFNGFSRHVIIEQTVGVRSHIHECKTWPLPTPAKCGPILSQILPLLNKCFKHSVALSKSTLDIINTSPMPSNVFIKFSNWRFFFLISMNILPWNRARQLNSILSFVASTVTDKSFEVWIKRCEEVMGGK